DSRALNFIAFRRNVGIVLTKRAASRRTGRHIRRIAEEQAQTRVPRVRRINNQQMVRLRANVAKAKDRVWRNLPLNGKKGVCVVWIRVPYSRRGHSGLR